MIDKIPKTPERKEISELELSDLQAITAAFLDLAGSEETETRTNKRINATQVDITDWLKRRPAKTSELERVDRVELSMSNIYSDPEYIKKIFDEINTIDDFPVIHEELFYMDNETGRELYRGEWQRSFLEMSIDRGLFAPVRAQLIVHARNSGLATLDDDNVVLHGSSWDQSRIYSHETKEAQEVVGVLIDSGKELQAS